MEKEKKKKTDILRPGPMFAYKYYYNWATGSRF
jgi:hypothetical protein